MRNRSGAPAEIEGYVVNPIHVEDEHPRMPSNRIVAWGVGVIELDGEAQGFKGNNDEVTTIRGPLLSESSECQNVKRSIQS